jgi:hypothetical protein
LICLKSFGSVLGTGVAMLFGMATHPTISFEKPTVEERFLVLPTGVLVQRLVEDVRSAGLAFIAGSAMGWNRAQLRSWLVLDYEPAITWTRLPDGHAPHDPLEGLDDVEVSMLVDQTRQRVLAMVQAAAVTWRAPTFARDMVDARLAIAVYDRAGAEAYAPAFHGDMRLKDRVASLFIADYLTRPSDYARVVACDACGELAIGSAPRHSSWCAEPPTQSGIVERSRPSRTFGSRFTLKGVG